MNKAQLSQLLTADPWQTSGQIVKSVASDTAIDDVPAFVRRMLSELRASGEVKTTGKARGTRYALADAPDYAPPVISDDLEARVLAALAKNNTSATVKAALGDVDITQIRKVLAGLVKSARAEKTGNKRSARYWLPGKAPADPAPSSEPETVSVAKKPPLRPGTRAYKTKVIKSKAIARPVDDEPEACELPQPDPEPAAEKVRPKIDVADAIRLTLEKVPRRVVLGKGKNAVEVNVFTTDDLCKMASDEFDISRYHAGLELIEQIRNGKPPIFHRQHRYRDDAKNPGWRLYLWRPRATTTPSPSTERTRAAITSNARASASNGRPSPSRRS